MTARLSLPSHSYGAKEFSSFYSRHLTLGLVFASAIHCIAIAISFLSGTQSRLLNGTPPIIIELTPSEGPSLRAESVAPSRGVQSSPKSPDGIPIVVPHSPTLDAPVPVEAYSSSTDGSGNGSSSGVSTEHESGYGAESGMGSDPGMDAETVFEWAEVLPVPIFQFTPTYPELLKRLGVEGTVFVKVLVGVDGIPLRAEVIKSTSKPLEETALAAAAKWRFTPAKMNGVPVRVWVTIPFRFTIRQ